MTNPITTTPFSIKKWLLGTAALAIVALGGWGAWWLRQESVAWKRVEAEAKRLDAQTEKGPLTLTGASPSNRELLQVKEKETQAWLDILSMLCWGKQLEGFPADALLSPPASLSPKQKWHDLESSQAYLKEMEPVRSAIVKRVKTIKNADISWFSTQPNTHYLHEIPHKLVAQFLTLDFGVAYYTGDKTRAMEDLQVMLEFEKALDRQMVVWGTDEQRSPLFECLHQSLSNSRWTEEELVALLELVKDENAFVMDWAEGVNAMKGMLLPYNYKLGFWGAIASKFSLYGGLLPSEMVSLIQTFDELATIGKEPLRDQLQRKLVSDQDVRNDRTSAKRLAFMAYRQTAQVGIGMKAASVDQFRFARIAIGLQLYRMKKGAFPESLAALTEVGLHAEDLKQAHGGSFGYSLLDATSGEATDGPVAQLETVPSPSPDIGTIINASKRTIYPVMLSIRLM